MKTKNPSFLWSFGGIYTEKTWNFNLCNRSNFWENEFSVNVIFPVLSLLGKPEWGTLRSEANRDGNHRVLLRSHSNSAGLEGSARLHWILVKVLHPASILLKAQYFKSILNYHEWLLAWHKPFLSLSKSYCLCSLKVGLFWLQKKTRRLSHSTRLDNTIWDRN